jgi:general secretion pathway protein G
MLPFLNRRGVTLVELIIAVAILGVLAAAVIPISEVTVQRSKELELRRSLRLIRTAIDDYKADFDRAVLENKITKAINETGYPRELDDLVNGSDFGGLYPHKRRYLRHIPRDPFDEFSLGWGLHAYADRPDSTVYGGGDIYDVYSQSDRLALDGTSYRDW